MVPRRPNPGRREELEEALVDYVLAHGISDLSLRPLAEALGVSTYSLVYHFGSKDGVVAAVVAHVEERERAMAAAWIDELGDTSLGAIMRRYWEVWCLPDELAPYHRLFYEVYALSLQQPGRFPAFLERGGAQPWLTFLRDVALGSGLREGDANLVAWLTASTVAGALLALLATGDKETATRTVEAAADYIEEFATRARQGSSLATFAPPGVIGLYARISENTPRDLRGVETLVELAARTFNVEPCVIEGRRQPFGRTPWKDDLEASREVLTATATCVAEALTTSMAPPLTLATDCALAIATLPAVVRLRPDTHVLWLDAHCDFDTPDTTTLDFLGCMSLAGACGGWETGFGPTVPARQVVLCGTRPAPDDFDIVAQQAVEQSEVTLVDITDTTVDDILAALKEAPVYVHLDPDVLDPSVNPVPYARPNGLTADALRRVLARVAARHPIVGVEITAFHAPDDPASRHALAALLLEAVAPLLAPRVLSSPGPG